MGELTQIQGRSLVSGEASGSAIVSDVPLSFWGGYDPERGRIIDQRHPLVGVVAAGQVLVIPSGRGSCSGSGIILEAIKNGVAPAAIITSRVDPIIALGAILGAELLGLSPPVVVIEERDRQRIASGDGLTVNHGGLVTVSRGAGDET